MEPVALIIAIALIVALFAGAGILMGILKLFKAGNPDYKRSLIIFAGAWAASMVFAILFAAAGLGIVSDILAAAASFLVFSYLLNRYHPVTWAKSLGIYVALGIAASFLLILIILPIRIFLVETFMISGDVMSPTYRNGDLLLVNKRARAFGRGDVVVYQDKERKVFIKRIVGLPGEKIEARDSRVFINGEVINEEHYASGLSLADLSADLGEAEYLVMGDNRGAAPELQKIEFVKGPDIIGRVILKIISAKDRDML